MNFKIILKALLPVHPMNKHSLEIWQHIWEPANQTLQGTLRNLKSTNKQTKSTTQIILNVIKTLKER